VRQVFQRFGPATIVIGLSAAVTIVWLRLGPTGLNGAARPDPAVAQDSASLPAEPAGQAARDPALEQAAPSAISRYALDSRNPRQFDLSRNLREVSGLALNERGTLFAHNDELATVFEIDPTTGDRLKSFRVGKPEFGDFEGITAVGRRIFLISSEGTLYEFEEAAADSSAAFQRHELATRDLCAEIEGIDYDARSDELLLACKITRGREQRGRLIVFAVSLATMTLHAEPRLSVSLDMLGPEGLEAELSPSGIAIHPLTGTLFLVAAQQDVLVEIDRAGRLLGVSELARRLHPQPEGVAFAPDGTLYIANEGRSGRANLTVYPVRPAAEGAARE
jgi:uncharacterized protein YjiK